MGPLKEQPRTIDINGDGVESIIEQKFDQQYRILASGIDPKTKKPLTPKARDQAEKRLRALQRTISEELYGTAV